MISFNTFGRIAGTCVNARDIHSPLEPKCDEEVDIHKKECGNYLNSKECDAKCNLCACSTGLNGVMEHCSGNGVCKAEICTQSKCQGAKCNCDEGFIGNKCQAEGYFILLDINHIYGNAI